MKGLVAVLVILGVLVVGGCSVVSIGVGKYNSMVQMDQEVSEKWSQVENVYQRRSDLIPNLVNTVKGYAKHEKSTFESVIQARASATQVKIDPASLTPESMKKFQAAQDSLSGFLSRLLMVTENYPDLKANQNFLRLQDELAGTENRIAVERKRYNETARSYNTTIKSFPGNLVANYFGFREKPYFEAEEKAKSAPVVDFGK